MVSTLSRRPVLVINYKTYLTGLGEKGLDIARAASLISKEYDVEIILAVPYTMIPLIARTASISVYAQHVDPLRPGRGTGFVTAREIALAGARGSLVNHSEHRLDLSAIHDVVILLHEEGLEALLCADTPKAALALSVLEPDMIAVEPPELIGTGVSVSKARPEVVSETVSLLRERGFNRPILVGAGVSNLDDARRSVELGADGILVSSAIMTSPAPIEKMKELVFGLLKLHSES